MKSVNIRNFWNELNVQFQFSHLKGKNYNTLYMSTYCCCTKLQLLSG